MTAHSFIIWPWVLGCFVLQVDLLRGAMPYLWLVASTPALSGTSKVKACITGQETPVWRHDGKNCLYVWIVVDKGGMITVKARDWMYFWFRWEIYQNLKEVGCFIFYDIKTYGCVFAHKPKNATTCMFLLTFFIFFIFMLCVSWVFMRK